MTFSPETWPRVSALLDIALELPEEQRISWIDSVTIGNPEIKLQLSALLTGTTRADELLCKPPDFSAALLKETQRFQQSEIELQPNGLIAPYRLLRELGQGGMGTVWLAQRVDGKFKRQVALKFPYAGPNQRQLAERLVREREILSSLEHPNIARLYDADVTTNGQPFLVLEYINGTPITEYCDQQRLNINERLKTFQQVLEAVRYAHSHLVIHRDLKPSNILITSDGVAHLLDFGIAKLTVNGEVKDTALTHISGHALTPDYASPEQLKGEAITTVSDVYSLGVLLYELLIGNRPYRLQRDTRNALEEAIVAGDIMLPSRADISEQAASARNVSVRQLRKALTGDLDTLIFKALKRKPAERYASADAFLDDVKRYIHNEPILAQPDTQWYRVRKFVSRNRVAVISVIAIAIALIIGSGAALWQAHIAKQQRDRAMTLTSRSEAIAELMRLMVTEIADADEPITMQTLLTRAEALAVRKFADNVDQHIAVLYVLGTYYENLQQAQLANQSFIKALALAENGNDLELKANLNCEAGYTFLFLGDDIKSRQYIDMGLNQANEFPDRKAHCLLSRSLISYGKADIVSSLNDLNIAKAQMQSVKLIDPEFPWAVQTSIARDEMEIGQVAAAKRLLNTELEQATGLGRSNVKTTLEILSLGEIYAGNPLGALRYLDKAAEIVRQVSPGKAEVMYANRYAALYYRLGRYTEALQLYRKGIEFSKKNHDATAIYSVLGIAKVELALGHFAKAEQQTRELEVMMNGDVHAVDGINAQNYLELKAMLGIASHHYADAVNYATENIDYLLSHKMTSTPLVTNLNLRSEAYLGNGNIAAALADVTQAYNIARSVQADVKYSRFSGESALLLAKTEAKRNQLEAAHKWATTALQQLQGSLGNDHPTTLEAKQLLDSMQPLH